MISVLKWSLILAEHSEKSLFKRISAHSDEWIDKSQNWASFQGVVRVESYQSVSDKIKIVTSLVFLLVNRIRFPLVVELYLKIDYGQQ